MIIVLIKKMQPGLICAKLRVKNGAKLNVQQNMLARGGLHLFKGMIEK